MLVRASSGAVVGWLRKSLLHSLPLPSSSALLGPNLPDIWVPRKNTSSDTHFSERHNCELEGAKSDAVVLGGKSLARDVKQKVAEEIGRIKRKIGKSPKLAVVLVGDGRDSRTFIHIKLKACEQVGIEASVALLPENCEEKELLDVVANFNKDPAVHGIIVQLPLPQHLNEENVVNFVSPEKDVDGFHPLNIGNLAMRGRKPFFIPCASMGCIELLRHGVEFGGKRAVVIGRSKIAGHHATVSMVHAFTEKPEWITSEAEIVVADVGIPNIIRGNWLKQGAVVIDMGTNQVKSPDKEGFRVIGDVCFEEAIKVAINPDPCARRFGTSDNVNASLQYP